MRPFLAYVAGVVLLTVTATPDARALTVVPRSFDELVARADTVFKGGVTVLTSQWVGEGATRHIVTLVTFRVDETYKGEDRPTQTLRFLGGTVDGVTLEVPGMPRFSVGQRAVLFVTGNGKQFCPLVGVHQGRFHVASDAAGIERVTTDDGSPVVNTTDLGLLDPDGSPRTRRFKDAVVTGMTADSFKAEILARVGASPGGSATRNSPQP